ncbi:MAG: hypothetical protein HYX34_08365 [Actinobacteria bacterium]|nr:hypothetical protein [Actinomycetota bacterium]
MVEHLDELVANRLEQPGGTVRDHQHPVAGASPQALHEEPGRWRGTHRDAVTHRERQRADLGRLRRDHDDDALGPATKVDARHGIVETVGESLRDGSIRQRVDLGARIGQQVPHPDPVLAGTGAGPVERGGHRHDRSCTGVQQ